MSCRSSFVALAAAAAVFFAGRAEAGESPVHRATHSSVRIVTPTDGVRTGDDLRVAVHFELEPEWHVYWVNPGQSGEPPRLRWTSPAGFRAGEPDWPVPLRIVVGGVVNFGYEKELFLPVTLARIGERATGASDLVVSLALSWLACRAEECIPATAELSLPVPVLEHEPSPDPRWHPRFESHDAAAVTLVPAALAAGDDGTLTVTMADAGSSIRDGSALEVFTYELGVVNEGVAPIIRREGTALEITLQTATSAPQPLERLTGLVSFVDGEKRAAVGFDASLAVGDSHTALHPGPAAAIGAAAAVLFAFVGGLLLNLMPCVFPVLSLKVLAFVERAHGDARETRAHGWAFTVGVLVSFWVLAATLLIVRAGGQQLGWGFQLQSPVFVALLIYLMLTMALSLAGMLELGSSLTAATGRAGMKEGLGGSFWMGALATIVATPCTAPFMGPALGFALTQPPAVSMAIFSSLGAGMAAPYLVLSYFPSALHRLPRPGPWMERLRQFMAFPLLASAVWLADVFAKQTGEGALVRLLAGAVLLAFALWLWSTPARTPFRRSTTRVAASLAVVAALALGAGAARVEPSSTPERDAHDSFWQPWSPAKVAALREEGRPVFVNFTAAWCLTCKVNEGAIFGRSDIRELFARHGVVPLEADWTNEDADIQATLASFGRDGIPLYVVYPADDARDATLLPQIPSYQDLESAFRGAR